MGLFKPIYMTKKIKEKDKALSAVENIEKSKVLIKVIRKAPLEDVRKSAWKKLKNMGVDLEKIANDNDIDDGIRIEAVKAMAKKDNHLNKYPYRDLIDRCLRCTRDSEHMLMAVEMSDDLERLKKAYFEIESHISKEIPYFMGRINQLAEALLRETSNRATLLKLKSDSLYSPSVRKAASEKLGDDGNNTDSSKNLTYVCQKCGKKIIYEEFYEKTYNESWNTVRIFKCSGGCWKTDNLVSYRGNYRTGNVKDEELNGGVIYICPVCYGVSGHTTYREPDLKKCKCLSKPKAIPISADLASW